MSSWSLESLDHDPMWLSASIKEGALWLPGKSGGDENFVRTRFKYNVRSESLVESIIVSQRVRARAFE